MEQLPDAFDDLCEAVSALRTRDDVAAFLRDACTLSELEAICHRLEVARLLDEGGRTYLEIAREVGTSTTTVTRVAHWLNHGEGGYRIVLDRLAERRS
jgi:TrpR-related protein YerC/YecD